MALSYISLDPIEYSPSFIIFSQTGIISPVLPKEYFKYYSFHALKVLVYTLHLIIEIFQTYLNYPWQPLVFPINNNVVNRPFLDRENIYYYHIKITSFSLIFHKMSDVTKFLQRGTKKHDLSNKSETGVDLKKTREISLHCS